MGMAPDNSALSEAIIRLESFLIKHGQTFWAGNLRGVRQNLAQDEQQIKARMELDSYFGGMGSLNDLYFENAEDEAEFGRLADAVFRENRLIDGGLFRRLQWRLYSLIYRNELPPRIKNGFQ